MAGHNKEETENPTFSSLTANEEIPTYASLTANEENVVNPASLLIDHKINDKRHSSEHHYEAIPYQTTAKP